MAGEGLAPALASFVVSCSLLKVGRLYLCRHRKHASREPIALPAREACIENLKLSIAFALAAKYLWLSHLSDIEDPRHMHLHGTLDAPRRRDGWRLQS